MRTRNVISTSVTALLFLGAAVLAHAQEPAVPPAPQESEDNAAEQNQPAQPETDRPQQQREQPADVPQPSEQSPDVRYPRSESPAPLPDAPARRDNRQAPSTPPVPGQETDQQPGAPGPPPRSTFRQEGRAAAEADVSQRMGFEIENRQDGHLIVSSVSRDTLAARAGLRNGDIIVSANGRRFSSHRDFHGFLDRWEGRHVNIVVFRDGLMRTLTFAPPAPRQSFYRGPAGAQGPPPAGYYNGGRYRGTTWYHGSDPYWCYQTYSRPATVYGNGVIYRGYRYDYDDDDYDDYEIEIERDGDIDIDD